MAMVPVITLFEPLSECMVIGGCAAWAVSVLFNWDSLGFYLIHILLWFISDWILLSIVQVNQILIRQNESWSVKVFVFRTDRCRSTSSTLWWAGCSASAPARTSSCTPFSTRGYGGGRASIAWRGAASPRRSSPASSSNSPALSSRFSSTFTHRFHSGSRYRHVINHAWDLILAKRSCQRVVAYALHLPPLYFRANPEYISFENIVYLI